MYAKLLGQGRKGRTSHHIGEKAWIHLPVVPCAQLQGSFPQRFSRPDVSGNDYARTAFVQLSVAILKQTAD